MTKVPALVVAAMLLGACTGTTPTPPGQSAAVTASPSGPLAPSVFVSPTGGAGPSGPIIIDNFSGHGVPETFLTARDVERAIKGECTTPREFHTHCVWDGPAFSAVLLHGPDVRHTRGQLCQYVAKVPVMTDSNTWAIWADDPSDTKRLRKPFRVHGYPGAVKPYCATRKS